jgi:tRNA A-37 threonylcarbamoyl transferase component Bud32
METMETIRMCKQCGAPLTADAPQGLCPKCLMEVGLGSGFQPQGSTATNPARSTAPTPAELARLFPQLEILEMLGQGGMGIVYKARQPKLDRFVALKILPLEAGRDPHFAERFEREARALAKLTHPNIVAVHDSGQAGEYFYFIMEFVDGANLRQMMRAGTLTPKQALVIVPAICDALQYAHDESVVHRDIKPENVLVDKKGRVKIADFGLAKLLGKEPADFGLTASGSFMGTPKYMAPEQIEKPQEVDHRADIYSLGVVFYEMLTGELPLGRFAAPSKKVQIDVRLDEVVLRTLEKEPGLRYQQASEVKNEVENISGLVEKLPAAVRNAVGFEYKSKATLFGLPLLHVAYGVDLQTGKKRKAKGIIAFGDIATGVFSFGGIAMGGFCFGGLCIGLVPFGGVGIGVLALCGMGIGLVASYSGLSIAPIALGGLSIGYYAMGGYAMGVHAIGGNHFDPEAREFFGNFAFYKLFFGYIIILIATLLLSMTGHVIRKWKTSQRTTEGSKRAEPRESSSSSSRKRLGIFFIITIAACLAVFMAESNFKSRNPVADLTVLKSFAGAEQPLSAAAVSREAGMWSVTLTNAQTVQLFEVANPGVENCTVIYRAKLKSEGLVGRGYLEMWCRFPDKGEFFSRGFDHVISGTTGWAEYQTPFFLKAGEKPDLIRLNLVIEGPGKIDVKDVELLKAPPR